MIGTVPCPFCATLNRVDLDRPLPVNADCFDAVLRGSEVPVLVNFYADWCGPCKK